jgi:KipI family sensor histidine kinase inhibitor
MNSSRFANVSPLGDRAFLIRFEDEDRARLWYLAARRRSFIGVDDLVLAYRSAAVYFNPDRVDPDALLIDLESIDARAVHDHSAAAIVLPVLYDGVDLPFAAERLGLSINDVINEHASRVYHVFAIGFQPGFPYAGYLSERLAGIPRLESPRTRTPAGSVAVAGRQTGVYPNDSPGGWRILGRTPLRIVDFDREFFPIRAGDSLRFRSIDRDEFERREGELLDPHSNK